jgi:hypothetical protein
MDTISTAAVTLGGHNVAQEPSHITVKVIISYPKDFKGTKFYNDGDEVEVSQESADQLIGSGFATLPGAEKPAKKQKEEGK